MVVQINTMTSEVSNMSDNGGQASCEYCNNLVYDEEMEEYVCDVDMDEDDYARLLSSSYRNCPYYQSTDEYKVVRHQM